MVAISHLHFFSATIVEACLQGWRYFLVLTSLVLQILDRVIPQALPGTAFQGRRPVRHRISQFSSLIKVEFKAENGPVFVLFFKKTWTKNIFSTMTAKPRLLH